MKDPIISSSSRPPILSSTKPYRLYIVTGKGGVGKTALALALTKKFCDSGYLATYNSFDMIPPHYILNSLKLPFIYHSLEESAQTYIGQKLGSLTVGKWVMKAPFFKALFNMLPGLASMILLGHLIKHLEDNPDLIMVIDSPASGHAMTLFEAPFHFRDMFKQGLIVEDIERMLRFVRMKNALATIITTLPTELSIQESLEFQAFLDKLHLGENEILINQDLNRFIALNQVHQTDLPQFLQNKAQDEKLLIEQKNLGQNNIPYFTHNNFTELIEKMTVHLKNPPSDKQ